MNKGASPNDLDAALHGVPISARLIIAALAGICAGAVVGLAGFWRFAPLAAWDVAALVYVIWVWTIVLPLSMDETARLASREDPGPRIAEAIILSASIISLIVVAFVLVKAGDYNGVERRLHVGLSVLSVIISWTAVHTMFALRYARLYYDDPRGGIDFNEDDPPTYVDFAYLAFTIGMTFQVSDTNLKTKAIRASALQQGLLSYLFGTIIVASTINLLSGMIK